MTFAVVFVCLLLFFWRPGHIPFYTKGEPREGVVVWEIYTSGEWILPLRNGTEIPSKPPLFHWLGALISHISGRVNEFTIRFPSAILATLGVLLTYLAGGRLWGKEAGLIAALVLATSFEWWRAATTARVDMTLTFFMVAAFLFFLFLYREGKSGKGKPLTWALLLGLATLAKGPVGAFLPCLTALAFLLLRRDLTFIRKLQPFTSAALFLLVAGSWYALATWQGGERFFAKQIMQENLLRFIATEAGGTGHQHPFYYFIPNLFLGMAPWSFFFPALALFLYHRRHTLADDGLLYPLVWFGMVFLFYSAASGKRSVYILPLYPAVALLLGAWWQRLRVEGQESSNATLWLVRLSGYLCAALFLLSGGVLITQAVGGDFLAHIRPFLHPKDQGNLPLFARFVADRLVIIFAWLSLTGLTALFLLRALSKHSWGYVFTCLTTLTAATLFLVSSAFHPVLAQERTFKPFMARVNQVVEAETPLFFYRSFDYGALFYAGRHIPRYQENLRASAAKAPFFLLMWEEEWERIRQRGEAAGSLSLSDISISFVDISEGTGPKGNHRLVLVSVQEEIP
jgi:4-amino-4-deoxy-L-arabinose transferase-like glycosyltransferase